MEKSRIARVIIFGWDGAGNFVTAAETPHLDNLIRQGTFAFDALTVSPTISAQCWGALMHGVTPDKHGLTNEIVGRQTYPDDSPYPSIFRAAREADPDAKLASFCSWNPINHGIIESSIGVHKATVELADEDASLPNAPEHKVQRASAIDRRLAMDAASYIRANSDVKLLYIDFDLPDAAGHQFGYNTPEQLQAIGETDGHTGIVLRAIEEAGILEDSLIIVVSDHGGGGERSHQHGSDHPLDKTIFWGCVGPGIAPGAALEQSMTITDTAAVVAHALGFAAPASWEAKLPQRLFT
ncbi:alkaline phosphatase family protein [Paenibacillus allorhizosphaerae]|uniref:Nucleotide pyrophosphatase n=1 Tax=Paenibacillus allorhizosphaerae TaxID=2849866 RepID=A0ABN7TR11_9BACL|nr:alkaline phosphatase family protein [Paenibacillus allorhizosphaerae]CAG7652250.1 hypothetical protein PAECIP111802_05175 [Paenibacillus allorhizosphaerae]